MSEFHKLLNQRLSLVVKNDTPVITETPPFVPQLQIVPQDQSLPSNLVPFPRKEKYIQITGEVPGGDPKQIDQTWETIADAQTVTNKIKIDHIIGAMVVKGIDLVTEEFDTNPDFSEVEKEITQYNPNILEKHSSIIAHDHFWIYTDLNLEVRLYTDKAPYIKELPKEDFPKLEGTVIRFPGSKAQVLTVTQEDETLEAA